MNNSSMNTGEERITHDEEDDGENEDAPEESGWTVYFDEFFSNNRELVIASPSSSYGFSGSPSLVSDAASMAAWNKPCQSSIVSKTDKAVISKKLRFLKKKGILREARDVDDALEDTASSPVNSPKVNKQFDHLMNSPRKNEDHASCNSTTSLRNKNLGMGGAHFSEMQTDDTTDHGNHLQFLGGGMNERETTECTVLKKKGLNYFG